MATLPTVASPWYRVTTADAVFVLLTVAIIQGAAGNGMVDDPGLGWHLRNIDAMIDQGGWLWHDPFSLHRNDQAWHTNQWIGDLLLWLGDHWAGLTGIAAVTTLILAFTFRCLYRILLADGIPWPVAMAWTLIGALATSTSWLARPNILTLLFTLWTARWCEGYHRGVFTQRQTLWILPLMTVWANSHGAFLVGLLLLMVAVGCEFLLTVFHPDKSARQSARQRGGHFVLLTCGAILATFINPYGPEIYYWLTRFLGESYFQNLNVEWQSPNFHLAGAFRYELLMLLFPAILAWSRRRCHVLEIGFGVVWLHFALNSWRMVPLWALIIVPTLARASIEIPWFQQCWKNVIISPDLRVALERGGGKPSWLISVLFALVFLIWAKCSPTYAQHDPQHIPIQALQRCLEVHEPGTPVLHNLNWGGYLIGHGWRRGFRAWIDDRHEVYGRQYTQDYLALLNTQLDWEAKIKELDIRLVCLLPRAPLVFRLSNHPEWEEIYRDRHAVLLRKITLPPPPPRSQRAP